METSQKKSNLPLYSILATSGVIATPYVGDALGVSAATVPEIMTGLHGTGLGSGIAGGINTLISGIPLVGETLAAGGVATAATSSVIGIGGLLLGNYLDKKSPKKEGVSWGKILKYSCLTTSVLIALPSILTGLSVGLTYLSTIGGVEVASSVMTYMANTIGATGATGAAAGVAGLSTAMTHLLTCGGAALSMCGAVYLDKKKQNSVNVEMAESQAIIPGKTNKISLRLKDDSGKILSDSDLQTTHTKKLHLMLVDKSLRDYHHIHPEYDNKTGLFTASFVPQSYSAYSAWGDFTLPDGSNHVVKNIIPSTKNYDIAPSIQISNSASLDGIEVNIKSDPPLKSGSDSLIKIDVTDKFGKPVELEEIMGAKAHLVGFSKDGENYIHCHPVESAEDLKFNINPQNEGFTKFFLQIKTNGKESTIPFGQYIQPPTKFSERQTTLSQSNANNNCHSL